MKNIIANTALLIFSVAFSYVFLEIGYRVYWHETLSEQMIDALVHLSRETGDDNRTVFDPQVGYRYRPNRAWQNQQSLWRTNEHGLIANDIDRLPYPTAKPPGEFRIAVIGDSFAAGNAVYLRWPDLLQDYLNRMPEWRRYVGGKFTRVINFGMDGTGIVQWAPVYRFRAREFDPDLVIVSYFIDDVMRQFVYRGYHTFKSDQELRDAVAERVRAGLAKLPWFGIYPELLAATLGPYIGLQRHLVPTTAITAARFASQEEGIQQSVAALAKIRCLSPRTIIVKQPAIEELLSPRDDDNRWPSSPDLVGVQTKFERAAAASGIPLINIVNFGETVLTPRMIGALYNGPIDTHMSDYGVVIYASWVLKYLMNWVNTPQSTSSTTTVCN